MNVKIADDIREGATNTMITLHQQGEQINRTHAFAADIEQDLSRGEKLLGSLGGIFSRTWKPKKDDPDQKKGNHLEQREKLGLTAPNKGASRSRTPLAESADAMQKVEYEKAKQDDGLSDLSDILGELKEMAVDMGSEIERQNKAPNPLQDDVEEINFRVEGANERTRRLLGNFCGAINTSSRPSEICFCLLSLYNFVEVKAIFVPKQPRVDAEEDDGYLIFFTHDENTGKSSVTVIDAKTMSPNPVTRMATTDDYGTLLQ
ncbi:soluble N-ethylmaleimide-sensitive factor adaptor protein 33 [Artemisia annua]|uniref:Soluble N-ethylmaleimide-sensitive factor adaptor protein 33 n=1 Tax=Artemisia annua TaxID=35608 RepID=A0A2U1M0A5_ARTAN|nr:soluble N-ethylmaleimide-sensitive factor adaptor protein 33 [Artemisia annua]